MADDLMSMGEIEGISDLSYFRQLVPSIKGEVDLLRYQEADYWIRKLEDRLKAQSRYIRAKIKAWKDHKASLAPELSAFLQATGDATPQAAGHTTFKVTTLMGTTYTRKKTDWKLEVEDEEALLLWATTRAFDLLGEGDTETVTRLTAQGKKRIRDHIVGMTEEGAEFDFPDGATLIPPRASVATKVRGAPRLTELREREVEIKQKQEALADPIYHLGHEDSPGDKEDG